MNKDVLRLGGIAAVLLLGLGIAAYFYQRSEAETQRQDAERAKTSSSLIRPHSHSQGPPNAPVTVVEFLDPECEACRAMHPLVKRIQSEYGDRMRLVIRYMPYHANSVLAAGALEAAAEQNRYWEFLEVLFLNQPAWGNHHKPRPELIPELAQQIGLDMDAYQRSIDAGAYRKWVEIDKQDGIALGVKGTPTFFVNGRMLERLGYENLKALIEEELSS